MAWMRLMRVYRQVSRAAFCPLRAAGLTTSQFAVIAKIGASEGIAQQELAGSLSVTQGNTSTYTFTATTPGTTIYEAGPTENARHQVAMGLYGALVVRPPGLSAATLTTAIGPNADLVFTATAVVPSAWRKLPYAVKKPVRRIAARALRRP